MKIGILGGGQLSRMLALSGIPLGWSFHFYEPKQEHCVTWLGDLTQAPYDDQEAIKKFALDCDVITFENENIPEQTIEILQSVKPVYPSQQALATTQDRLLEKTLFTQLAIHTVPFQNITCLNDVNAFIEQHNFPVIIKSRRQGYDGKGQIRIKSHADLATLHESQVLDSIVEKQITFDREVSMIAVRNTRGEIVYYDLCENVHEHGVLVQTMNKIDDPLWPQAKQAIDKILTHFHYVGTLAFEFFVVNNTLYANELAPRVHNSGHWTIEGAHTSQFENHLRAISGHTLGNSRSIAPYKMINLLGSIPEQATLLGFDSLHLHDYQKTPRSGRKVGHLTCPITEQTDHDSIALQKLIVQ